jgi:hypothetical protein
MAETITFNTLIESLRSMLVDITIVTFEERALEQAIRDALREISQVMTYHTVGTVTLSASGREISLSTLTQPCAPYEIWLPYTAATPEDPPRRRTWQVLNPNTPTVWISDGGQPASADVARVFYSTLHTISGLDSGASTTLPDIAIRALLTSAAAACALARRADIVENTQNSQDALKRFSEIYQDWRAQTDTFIKRERSRAEGGFTGWT